MQLQDKRNSREENHKDIEELYCCISTRQQNEYIGHLEQGHMESREHHETGRNNTPCEILVSDTPTTTPC